MFALPASDTQSIPVHVDGWTATLVNGERLSTPSGGSFPVCLAIPETVLTLRVRAPSAPRVRLRITVPGHAPRHRTVRLRRAVSLTPGGLRLRDAAFPEGRYTVRISRGGRVLARASLQLAAAGWC